MRYKIILILLLYSTFVFSQKKGDKGLIDAKYKCTYSIKFVNDTIKMTQGPEDWFILLIGDNFTYGYSYLDYYADSLLFKNPRLWALTEMENIKNGTITAHYSSSLMYARLYKNYKENRISAIDLLSTYLFIYEEKLTPQDWVIQEDTMTIAGYSCQKAACDYRGRSYEAWFTSEIPISEGPWKFCGLPGLIVRLYDTKRHYDFELIEVKETDEKIDMRPLSTKKIWSKLGQRTLMSIDRETFLKTKFGEKGKIITDAEMAKVGLPNSAPATKKYGYIELDYR